MQLPAWMSTFLKVDTAAVADMSAQFVPSSAAKDSALSAQHQLHTASRVKDPNETTEATGGDEPSTTTPGNLEGAGGVVPITTPAAEVQQAAQQHSLLAHLALAGTLSITSKHVIQWHQAARCRHPDCEAYSAVSNNCVGHYICS